jgi:hypothetical protein
MDAGKITHFGSFEQVRDAGATFALASTAGDANTGKNQIATKQNATEATVIDEEKDEEEAWISEQASRSGAYTFYAKCTGFLHTGTVLTFITIWSGVGLFATAYLSSARPLFSASQLLIDRRSAGILFWWPSGSLGSRLWWYSHPQVRFMMCPSQQISYAPCSLCCMAGTLMYFSYVLSSCTAPNIHIVRDSLVFPCCP